MYRAIVGIIRVFVKVFFRVRVDGLEHIPKIGGAVVAANHTSWFDPVLLAVVLQRPLHFMAKAELFRHRIMRWLFLKVYAFPVRRGLADRDAIREAQERVKDGHLLGIFPEGTRNREQEGLLPIQGGAALIALKTGVPLIPVVFVTERPVRPGRVMQVRIGSPIDLGGPKRANKQEIARANSMILAEFSALIRRNN